MRMAGRLRRILPPLALFAGLFFFGLSLLILGTEATDEGARTLEPSSFTQSNGTSVLLYRVEYYGARTERVDVTYAYSEAPGAAYFIGCADIPAARRGEVPAAPMLAFTGLREGSFTASHQTIAHTEALRIPDEDYDGYERYCDPAIVFQWMAPGDPTANRPEVSALYHSASLDGENFAFLAILMVASSLAALLGGLAWARARWRHAEPPASESTVETLRASLDRMGEQLERTRKNLLLAGVLGIFLWYPFLIPWAWQQAARSSTEPAIPWLVAGLALLFLLVLTALWAREFLRLDRELNAWRGRLWELRDREAHLMDALESEGG